jgi:predicted DNA-binding transcriptional regulator
MKQNKLTSKQLKERREYERMAVVSPIQKQKKAKTTTTKDHIKQSEIEIHHWLLFNADKLGEIIKQLEIIQKGLRQVGSLVRANYLLK